MGGDRQGVCKLFDITNMEKKIIADFKLWVSMDSLCVQWMDGNREQTRVRMKEYKEEFIIMFTSQGLHQKWFTNK